MSDKRLSVRRPAVAGSFYPAQAVRLQAEVDRLLARARLAALPAIKGLIVPHAGYAYSGPVAASGFLQLTRLEPDCLPVVYLLGPAHYVPVPANRVALAPFDRFDTPLGPAPQSRLAIDDMLDTSPIYEAQIAPHLPEHSLEVALPFLQTALEDFDLVAMLVGDAPVEEVARDLAARLRPEDLVVVSSDLSHFHPYDKACRLDRAFLDAVLAGDMARATQGEACGLQPILVLMRLAQLMGWQPTLLDYRNSGDTGGDRRRVVGYAAVAYA